MMPAIANLGQALDLSLPEAAVQIEGAIFGLRRHLVGGGSARRGEANRGNPNQKRENNQQKTKITKNFTKQRKPTLIAKRARNSCLLSVAC